MTLSGLIVSSRSLVMSFLSMISCLSMINTISQMSPTNMLFMFMLPMSITSIHSLYSFSLEVRLCSLKVRLCSLEVRLCSTQGRHQPSTCIIVVRTYHPASSICSVKCYYIIVICYQGRIINNTQHRIQSGLGNYRARAWNFRKRERQIILENFGQFCKLQS